VKPVGTRDDGPPPEFGTADHAWHVTKGRHAGTQAALQWLVFSHLPEALRRYSEPFYVAAVELVRTVLTDSPELTTALNKLVEAKDAEVRAGIRDATGRPGPVARPQVVVDPPRLEAERG
jgi:hypothetical protein